MLIFNCTEAASEFFSRVSKGKKITPVQKPPSAVIEGDEFAEVADQWLVHAATVRRKHVLYVIHVQTRYCMIFADAKKADTAGFVHRFSERWLGGWMRDAQHHDALQWARPDVMLERFNQSCAEYTLYKRGHRSAQGHIKEIAWIFEDYVAEWGALPADEIISRRFDAKINSFIKGSKNTKGYIVPDEEMMVHWLRRYCGLGEPGLEIALSRRRQVQEEIREIEAVLARDEQPSF